jgi:hypothetical protein
MNDLHVVSQLDDAMLALEISKIPGRYPSIKSTVVQSMRCFAGGAAQSGLSEEVAQWAQKHGHKPYLDFFCRAVGSEVEWFFRTEELAIEFKLSFL